MTKTKIRTKEKASECENSKLPPDPDCMNDEYADRARRVVALYCKLSGAEREEAIYSLLHHLMHLCDRDRRFGCFHQAHAEAIGCYEEATTERDWLKD